MTLLQPKEITIIDQIGGVRLYTISKFSAIQGREIVSKYPIANMPKLGDYPVSEDTMFKLMSYVGVKTGDTLTLLTTRLLVSQHVPDWETLAKVEMAMMEYNCSFFQNGRISEGLEKFVQKVLQSISQISTGSSAQSSQTNTPPSTNSEQSIP